MAEKQLPVAGEHDDETFGFGHGEGNDDDVEDASGNALRPLSGIYGFHSDADSDRDDMEGSGDATKAVATPARRRQSSSDHGVYLSSLLRMRDVVREEMSPDKDRRRSGGMQSRRSIGSQLMGMDDDGSNMLILGADESPATAPSPSPVSSSHGTRMMLSKGFFAEEESDISVRVVAHEPAMRRPAGSMLGKKNRKSVERRERSERQKRSKKKKRRKNKGRGGLAVPDTEILSGFGNTDAEVQRRRKRVKSLRTNGAVAAAGCVPCAIVHAPPHGLDPQNLSQKSKAWRWRRKMKRLRACSNCAALSARRRRRNRRGCEPACTRLRQSTIATNYWGYWMRLGGLANRRGAAARGRTSDAEERPVTAHTQRVLVCVAGVRGKVAGINLDVVAL